MPRYLPEAIAWIQFRSGVCGAEITLFLQFAACLKRCPQLGCHSFVRGLDMRRIGLLVCSIALTLVGSPASSAMAVQIARQDFQGAVGMCKPALPAYAANLRNRPLGMANESDSAVFLTCNWQGDDTQNGTRGARRVFVVVSNTSAADQVVACTLVNGFQSGALTVATYTPKTATIAAGASATIEWVPADIAGAPDQIKLPALSCNLPGGTTLQYTGKQYNEDVGA